MNYKGAPLVDLTIGALLFSWSLPKISPVCRLLRGVPMLTILAQVRAAKEKIESARALAGADRESFDSALGVLERAEKSVAESLRLIGAACLAVVDLRKQWGTDSKVRHRLDTAFAGLAEGEEKLGKADLGAV
jgi:hypothetical protein